MTSITFGMEEVSFEKNVMIFKQSDIAESIMILKHGCIEVYMYIDGV